MNLLIYALEANRTMNMEIFGRFLMVYDQNLVYRHRNWFKKFETTISYPHVSKFFLTEGIFFSEVEIVAPGLKESIRLRFVPKRAARITKFIIDEKVKVFNGKGTSADLENIDKIEKYMQRLYELKKNKKLSRQELEKRREAFLQKIEKLSRIG